MTPAAAILLAAPDLPGEAALVAACQRRGSPVVIARRCVDAVDLLGAAAGGTARVAVVGAALPRLTREVVARAGAAGVTVIGVVTEGDEESERFLRRLDIDEVVGVRVGPTGGDPEGAVRALAAMLQRTGGRVSGDAPEGEPGGPDRPELPAAPGRLVAVWGPTGAPGRTSVAIGLGDEAARAGTPALLVDADTYGGAMATLLGMWDEASGLAMASRRAETGHLDVPALAECARQLATDLRILSGITHADRWPELRATALRRLWEVCRATPGLTVVDTGFCLESDDEGPLSRRHATTLTALSSADAVVAVGSADPIGLGRLVAALPEVRDVIGGTPLVIAITRVRPGVLGRDPQARVREVLADLLGVRDDIVLIPEDRAGFDAGAREGRTLAEVAPGSPVRSAMHDLMELVADRVGWRSPAAHARGGLRRRLTFRHGRATEGVDISRVSA